jgi:hypothetical protein
MKQPRKPLTEKNRRLDPILEKAIYPSSDAAHARHEPLTMYGPDHVPNQVVLRSPIPYRQISLVRE